MPSPPQVQGQPSSAKTHESDILARLQKSETIVPSTGIPRAKVKLEVRMLLLRAMALLQKPECSEDDTTQAIQGTMSAYRLASSVDDVALASRCCFYVAYAHAMASPSSAKHRMMAMDFLQRATEASSFGLQEGIWASQVLEQTSARLDTPFCDESSSTRTSLIDSLRTLTNHRAISADEDDGPSTAISASPTNTDGSTSSSEIRSFFGTPQLSSRSPHLDREYHSAPASPSATAVFEHDLPDTPDQGKLCRPDKPTPEFLKAVSALQAQDQSVPSGKDREPVHSSSSTPPFAGDVGSDLLPRWNKQSSNTAAASFFQPPKNEAQQEPAGGSSNHRKSLSQSLLPTPKNRSEEAQMEEGESPTHFTFTDT